MANHSNHSHDIYHVTPVETYFKVFFALVGLTAITVGAAYVNFGGMTNVFIALLIAVMKASLVILWFMHQKYENHMNRVIFFSTFAFLAIFAIFTWADIGYRVSTTQIDVHELNKAP